MRPAAILLLVLGACATVRNLSTAELSETTCAGVARSGSASITCRPGPLAAPRRFRIVEVTSNAIVLVAEASDGTPSKNVPGSTTPLVIGGLAGGQYTIVLRGTDGAVLPVGSVDVPPREAGELLEDQSREVYGTQ